MATVAVEGKSALGQALEVVVRAPRGMTEKRVDKRIDRCKQAIKELLPVEEQAKRNLTGQLAELKATRLRVKYPEVPLEVLGWRDKEGFPKLALFDSKESLPLVISSNRINRLPKALDDYYQDVQKKLAARANLGPAWFRNLVGFPLGLVGFGLLAIFVLASLGWRMPPLGDLVLPDWAHFLALPMSIFFLLYRNYYHEPLRIAAHYEGTIPVGIRQKIAAAGKVFEQVYLLAEVPKWVVEFDTQTGKDPLVVGYLDGHLYLIAVFDATPVENYVVREFVTK